MVSIAGVPVGEGHPCRLVAEMSNAHNGCLDRALRIIAAAKEAGADFIKMQAYTPDELVALRGDGPAPEPWGSQGWSMRRLYEKAQTPLDWFPRLVEECEAVGIPWFSSVFGPESLAVLESLDCPAYKVARLDNRQAGLRRRIQRTGKPVIVSRDGSEVVPWKADLVLLCPPGYPQERFGFRSVFEMDWQDPVPWAFHGFSYHGTDPFVPLVAVAAGAKVVEVHLQLEREPSELESHVSLNERQLRELVVVIRAAEEVLRG
jgi:sialic acid synthase SpsE